MMNYELLIARRLKLTRDGRASSPSLTIATTGIVLAIVVMILSVAIVMGFKGEIASKIYNLDAHLRIINGQVGLDDNYATVRADEVLGTIAQDEELMSHISSMCIVADKSAILKTDSDFVGLMLRGVDDGYDWSYIKQHLDEGRVPVIADSALTEAVISRLTANALGLHAGDKVATYFIDDKVRVRNMHIVGIYNTDLDAFDKVYMLGNIALVQQLNGWDGKRGNSAEVNLRNVDDIDPIAYKVNALLVQSTIEHEGNTVHVVTTTHGNNGSYFAWLDMLDMNVWIILILMMIVAAFTLVSALLMIVLERIGMIGMLKALGSTNRSIRTIFIALTHKLIFKAMLIGNIIGIGLALLQKYGHIVRLDPASYYMSYVPIELNIWALIALNVGILVISALTLIAPSYIISTIRPASTMRWE